MKVLLVTSMYPPYCGGGVSSHVRDLAESLAASGDDVWVLSSRRGQAADGAESTSARGAPRLVFCPDYRHMALRIGRLVRKVDFDIVHFHSFNALALAPVSPPDHGASVFTMHSDTANWIASIRDWNRRSHPAYALLRAFERMSVRWPDVTIAVDRRLERYARDLGARRTILIPNAVDCGFWSPGDAGGTERGSAPSLLVPRMLVPKNGVDVAIRALSSIRSAIPTVRMVIAGDGPLRPNLESLARSAAGDAVTFLGEVPRDRMRPLYRQADAVLIPSVTSRGLQEATSIAALEAMACGRPVVASRIGGLRELIDDGDDGLLVAEGDPAGLADAVMNVLRDPANAERLGARAREKVLRTFSVPAWLGRVHRAYAQALESRGRPGSFGGG